ncbi:hypothetical protein B0H63DRAFT_20908 [Podospora didyma]|uniref:Uncharacterized protein n=1 Tax=Podospora didyma TaxID=330526 RepID=A0AAE0P5D2_9PEZI|nr:hypothetical protein B0H63DRAFT_20908 [Podospora didyma]
MRSHLANPFLKLSVHMKIQMRLVGTVTRCPYGTVTRPTFSAVAKAVTQSPSITSRALFTSSTTPSKLLSPSLSSLTTLRPLSSRLRWEAARVSGRAQSAQSLATAGGERHASSTTPTSKSSSPLARDVLKTSPSSKTATSGGSPPPGASRLAFPEHITIYYAGTGKNTFLAMMKLTTIFVFVFFGFVVTPSYLMAHEPWTKTAGVALCGVIPLVYVAFFTSPFVTTIRIHLPVFARSSAEMLKRFARTAPPSTRLDITTMTLIGKPRVSSVRVGDLQPVHRRLGMVNYVRETAALNSKRKWYRFRAVGKFHVQAGNDEKIKTGWVWREIADAIAKRQAPKP